MVRQGRSIAVVGVLLIGCAVLLLVVGGSRVLAEASQHNKQKLSGTNGKDNLEGGDGDDEVRGLGGTDDLEGGPGSDTLYGGDGDDYLETLTPFLEAPYGEDVLYGGDGSDQLYARDGQQDEIYCGEGKDVYDADKNDYVDSSCEKKARFGGGA